MKKRILFYIYKDMADFEMSVASYILGVLLEFKIDTFAVSLREVRAKSGVLYKPYLCTESILKSGIEEFDGLIIPGGWFEDTPEEILEIIRKFDSKGKLVAAICAGPKFLAASGILKGRKYTTTLTPERVKEEGKTDIFPREGYLSEKVVRDKNIITALGFSFIDFGVEIADYFGMFTTPSEKEDLQNVLKGF